MYAIKVLNTKNDTIYNYVFVSSNERPAFRGFDSVPVVAFRLPEDAIVFETLDAARRDCYSLTYLFPGLKLQIEEWDRAEVKFVQVVEKYAA